MSRRTASPLLTAYDRDLILDRLTLDRLACGKLDGTGRGTMATLGNMGTLHEVRPGRVLYVQTSYGNPEGELASNKLVALLIHGAMCHHSQVLFPFWGRPQLSRAALPAACSLHATYPIHESYRRASVITARLTRFRGTSSSPIGRD